jgi:peptidoglycan/LPS O-acetylase OafA/YrhL
LYLCPSFPILTYAGIPDEHYRWAYTQIGAVFLVFAIHFSPLLRRIYSFRPAVFFGSISFAVYLTHSFLMRSVLVWVVHGVLPQSSEEAGWLIWVFLRTLAYVSWIALVIFISTVWRDNVDTFAMTAAQWSEEVVLGQRSPFDTIGGMRYKLFRDFKHDQENRNVETPASREKAQV